MMMEQYDFLIVGAGIAGVSVAAHLAERHRVIVVDMEERAGYHSTGRSAARYESNYGPPPFIALTKASKDFFDAPPHGFADQAIYVPSQTLMLEADGQAEATTALLDKASGIEEVSPQQARQMMPLLRDGYVKRAFIDTMAGDLDVDILHQGFIKLMKARGAKLRLNAPLKSVTRTNGGWTARCGNDDITAGLIINAAGAWGDAVAQMCGAKPMGLQPKRRSIAVVPVPDGVDVNHLPFAGDIGETWYAKPQSGKLLVSSADATPVDPHDAWADDMAIAEGIDRLMQATTLEIERVESTWGGLRTFAPDGCPVAGFDPHTEGFFWLVGQGGYGIQSSPALARSAAALVYGKAIPQDILDYGLKPFDISPERFSS
jgi:D-arginine dehydrogenase